MQRGSRLVEDAATAVLQQVREGEADEDIDFVAVIRNPFVLACCNDHALEHFPVRRNRLTTRKMRQNNRLGFLK